MSADRQESPCRQWVDTKTVAKHLGITERTVSTMHRAGRIPGNRNGSRLVRFELAEVDAAMQRNEAPPRHEDDFMAEVRRIVDLAPKLTPAQRDLIATILRPTAGGELSA